MKVQLLCGSGGNLQEMGKKLLIVSVEDTGIGISDENKEKLFGSFERFDNEKE